MFKATEARKDCEKLPSYVKIMDKGYNIRYLNACWTLCNGPN